MRPLVKNHDYLKFHHFQADLGGMNIPFVSKLGLPDWNIKTPSDDLIAAYCHFNSTANVLILGCGKGISAAYIANSLSHGKLWTSDVTITAIRCTKDTLQLNNLENCVTYDDLTLLPHLKNEFDAAIIILPKGRKLARRWLVETKELLGADKELFLVGANSEGIQSIIKDAEALFGTPCHILGYKKGHRIAKLTKKETPNLQDWSTEPGIAPETWHHFDVNLDSTSLLISSLPGVFSYQQLDAGTAFLLKHLKIDENDQILDIGCGYGIIGLSAACHQNNVTKIDMVDSNIYAIACCRKNLIDNLPLSKRNKVKIYCDDLLSSLVDQKYSLIVSNPPFHSGKSIDFSITSAMIEQTSQVLDVNGRFILVANKFIRYEKLLDPLFSKVTMLAQNNRYQVIEAAQVMK